MPSLKEIEYYLRGIVLLIQGKPQGFGYLDLTDRGMIRSFWAMVWCFPATAISWVWWQTAFLRAYPPGTKTGLPFFLRLAMVEIANWIVPLVLAGLLCLALRLGRRFLAIVVVSNWLAVPLSYLYALIVLIVMFVPGAAGIASLLWLALILLLIFSLIRLLRMICGQQPLIIATLVLLLLVPSMFLSDYLQQYLGVYPA
ncbi:MAG: hypothetical protein BGO05_25990 [Rhizobiales bacterium 63-7]|nr:hypothetical protein [Hyphomicrobiales bacterium]OJU70625.1 MAG: hypothetical protein BGO05_25990 [Rhizobiales bacterium 63-7]